MSAFPAACAGHRSRPRGRTTERNDAMSTPAKADVDDATKDALTGLALGDVEVLEQALELREAWQERSGLDPRAFSLVKIAALIAVDAPPASYLWQVSKDRKSTRLNSSHRCI